MKEKKYKQVGIYIWLKISSVMLYRIVVVTFFWVSTAAGSESYRALELQK